MQDVLNIKFENIFNYKKMANIMILDIYIVIINGNIV
jgi:hypothetical protein